MKKGDEVKLLENPNGRLSRHYPVTVGGIYKVVGLMGSCLVVTTDVPGESASIWRGRFEVVSEPDTAAYARQALRLFDNRRSGRA